MSTTVTKPKRRIRSSNGASLQQLAADAGTTYQALYHRVTYRGETPEEAAEYLRGRLPMTRARFLRSYGLLHTTSKYADRVMDTQLAIDLADALGLANS